jgi:hypothetical protein
MIPKPCSDCGKELGLNEYKRCSNCLEKYLRYLGSSSKFANNGGVNNRDHARRDPDHINRRLSRADYWKITEG